jgi:hypothetical protein
VRRRCRVVVFVGRLNPIWVDDDAARVAGLVVAVELRGAPNRDSGLPRGAAVVGATRRGIHTSRVAECLTTGGRCAFRLRTNCRAAQRFRQVGQRGANSSIRCYKSRQDEFEQQRLIPAMPAQWGLVHRCTTVRSLRGSPDDRLHR